MTVNDEVRELQFLHKIKPIEAPKWLIPSESRSELAREGAKELFSILKPYAPKSPFEKLLVDGFDAEQIWQQIDLQSQPVLATLRREVKRYERNPDEFVKMFGERDVKGGGEKKSEFDDVDEDMKELDDDDDDDDDVEELDERREGEESETDSEDEEEEEENVRKKGVFEDKFLKVDELEEYLENDEEREYGVDAAGKKKNSKKGKHKEESSEDDEDDDDDEIDLFEGGADEEDDEAGDLMYGDFFGSNKKKEVKRNSDLIDGLEDSMTDGEEEKEEDDEEGDEDEEGMENKKLSTYQKETLKRQAQIDEIEKHMLDRKPWALQGEVTAAQRPKNSALEVDLEYDHNVRPAPVITEEITISLEEMIKKRILEGRFDDVQKPPSAPTKAPRERKELDETKSKKGLGEIYEDEYNRNANPDAAPLTFSDELKNEASLIFKKLCLKLDALSHFHFAPKPIIEDMSLPETNNPALVMEEVAPIAVSEAAMLAPEEVYDGKGDFKEETELTQAERKRRRANKKRKFQAVAAKHASKRVKEDTVSNPDGKEAF